MAIKLEIGRASQASRNHLGRIEDRLVVVRKRNLVAEIDGLGSSGNPVEAARTAKRTISKLMGDLPRDSRTTPTRLAADIEEILLDVNGSVRATGGRATVDVAKMWESPDGRDKLVVISDGHGRVSRVTDRRLVFLTLDASLQALVQNGEIDEDKAFRIQTAFSNASSIDEVPGWIRPFAGDYTRKVRNGLGSPQDEFAASLQTRIVDFPQDAAFIVGSDGIHLSVTSQTIIDAVSDPTLTNKQTAEQILKEGERGDVFNAGVDDRSLLIVTRRKSRR